MSTDDRWAASYSALSKALGAELAHLIGPFHPASNYRRGELIFQQGDILEDWLIVVEGGVKIYRERQNGEHVVIAICSEGDAFCEPELFLGGSSHVSAESITSSRIVRISSRFLRGFLEQHPQMIFNMMAALNGQYVSLLEQIERLKTQSVPQRIADFLLKRLTVTRGSATLTLPYEKGLIANWLGAKPESFSRSLARLREIGVRVAGDKVWIGDVRKLAEYAGAGAIARTDGARRLTAPAMWGGAWSARGPVVATGFATQATFNSSLAAQWRKSIRSGAPISLLLIYVAQEMRSGGRQFPCDDGVMGIVDDVLSRDGQRFDKLVAAFGGGAVAVTLPAADRDEANKLAARIGGAIETTGAIDTFDGASRRLIASVGIATISPTETDRVEKIVCFADIALYRAKTSTGRRIQVFHDNPSCAEAKRSPSGGVRIPVIQSSHCARCRSEAPLPPRDRSGRLHEVA